MNPKGKIKYTNCEAVGEKNAIIHDIAATAIGNAFFMFAERKCSSLNPSTNPCEAAYFHSKNDIKHKKKMFAEKKNDATAKSG